MTFLIVHEFVVILGPFLDSMPSNTDQFGLYWVQVGQYPIVIVIVNRYRDGSGRGTAPHHLPLLAVFYSRRFGDWLDPETIEKDIAFGNCLKQQTIEKNITF